MTREEVSGWPEQWLTSGCGPLGHTLIALSAKEQGPALRCTRCDRRESVDGTTCLVCNDEGVQRVSLYRVQSLEPIATGVLCERCAAALLAPGGVAGWWAAALEGAVIPDRSEGLQAGDSP